MTTLFVTGSGTDIGKTVVCCRLLEELAETISIRCIKPIVTGFEPDTVETSDTARLLKAQGIALNETSIAETSPWRFRAPLSADMAAAREGSVVPFEDLIAFSQPRDDTNLNLIEGIGGVMAPIDTSHTVLDWIDVLQVPVLLVVGSYLGSISHSLTALNALGERDIETVAIVISQSLSEPVPTEETAETLSHFAADIPIVTLPRSTLMAEPLLSPALARRLGLD